MDPQLGFNWHGFAEVAATKAHAATTITDAEAWASISVRFYERLAEHAATFELSAMHVRASMISRYGESAQHPVRDMQNLVAWFRQNIPMPIADVEREATRMRALPIEQWSEHLDLVRTLRALKNRIAVFEAFDHPPDELRPWLALAALLP